MVVLELLDSDITEAACTCMRQVNPPLKKYCDKYLTEIFNKERFILAICAEVSVHDWLTL